MYVVIPVEWRPSDHNKRETYPNHNSPLSRVEMATAPAVSERVNIPASGTAAIDDAAVFNNVDGQAFTLKRFDLAEAVADFV